MAWAMSAAILLSRRRARPIPERPSGFNWWQPGSYEVAAPLGQIETVNGFTCRGLGLHRASLARARYVRKDGTRKTYETWVVTHLNTGHAVRGFVDTPAAHAFVLASDLADLADWTFDGLQGWQNTDPELPDKLAAWHARHSLGARPGGLGANDDIARAIGAKRW